MNISKAARATGLTAKAIRYYEDMELMTPASRKENGYRDYNEVHLRELLFISQSRELGFTLKECADLINLYKDQGRKSADVKKLALQKIDDVENKISQLHIIRESLKEMTECCHGDEMPDCPILDKLASAKNTNAHKLKITN